MSEIYVIVSGAYSDWQLEGYAADREQAELICYHHNQLPDKEKDWLYGDWHVMLVDEIKLEGTIKGSIYWNYRFDYFKPDKDWILASWMTEDDYVKCSSKAIMPSIKHIGLRNEAKYRIEWSNTRFLSCKEAQKIAYDMLMQQLAAELLG